MLYCLARTHVKAFFGKSELPLAPAYGMPYSPGTQFGQPQMTTSNTGYGRPPAIAPPVTFPSLSQGSSTTIPATGPGSTPSSSSPSSEATPMSVLLLVIPPFQRVSGRGIPLVQPSSTLDF